MPIFQWRAFTCVVACTLLLGGCASIRAIPPSAPVFVADVNDLVRYQSLVNEQEDLVASCIQTNSCAHLKFTRGMVYLFVNGEEATKYFHEVVELAPETQLASSSKLWIRFIEMHPRRSSWNRLLDGFRHPEDGHELLAWSTEQLARDLLNRELIIHELRERQTQDADSLASYGRELAKRGQELRQVTAERDSLRIRMSKAQAPSARILRREIAARDRKIEELSSQLEALKRIDQEMRHKTRPSAASPPSGKTSKVP